MLILWYKSKGINKTDEIKWVKDNLEKLEKKGFYNNNDIFSAYIKLFNSWLFLLKKNIQENIYYMAEDYFNIFNSEKKEFTFLKNLSELYSISLLKKPKKQVKKEQQQLELQKYWLNIFWISDNKNKNDEENKKEEMIKKRKELIDFLFSLKRIFNIFWYKQEELLEISFFYDNIKSETWFLFEKFFIFFLVNSYILLKYYTILWWEDKKVKSLLKYIELFFDYLNEWIKKDWINNFLELFNYSYKKVSDNIIFDEIEEENEIKNEQIDKLYEIFEKLINKLDKNILKNIKDNSFVFSWKRKDFLFYLYSNYHKFKEIFNFVLNSFKNNKKIKLNDIIDKENEFLIFSTIIFSKAKNIDKLKMSIDAVLELELKEILKYFELSFNITEKKINTLLNFIIWFTNFFNFINIHNINFSNFASLIDKYFLFNIIHYYFLKLIWYSKLYSEYKEKKEQIIKELDILDTENSNTFFDWYKIKKLIVNIFSLYIYDNSYIWNLKNKKIFSYYLKKTWLFDKLNKYLNLNNNYLDEILNNENILNDLELFLKKNLEVKLEEENIYDNFEEFKLLVSFLESKTFKERYLILRNYFKDNEKVIEKIEFNYDLKNAIEKIKYIKKLIKEWVDGKKIEKEIKILIRELLEEKILNKIKKEDSEYIKSIIIETEWYLNIEKDEDKILKLIEKSLNKILTSLYKIYKENKIVIKSDINSFYEWNMYFHDTKKNTFKLSFLTSFITSLYWEWYKNFLNSFIWMWKFRFSLSLDWIALENWLFYSLLFNEKTIFSKDLIKIRLKSFEELLDRIKSHNYLASVKNLLINLYENKTRWFYFKKVENEDFFVWFYLEKKDKLIFFDWYNYSILNNLQIIELINLIQNKLGKDIKLEEYKKSLLWFLKEKYKNDFDKNNFVIKNTEVNINEESFINRIIKEIKLNDWEQFINFNLNKNIYNLNIFNNIFQSLKEEVKNKNKDERKEIFESEKEKIFKEKIPLLKIKNNINKIKYEIKKYNDEIISKIINKKQIKKIENNNFVLDKDVFLKEYFNKNNILNYLDKNFFLFEKDLINWFLESKEKYYNNLIKRKNKNKIIVYDIETMNVKNLNDWIIVMYTSDFEKDWINISRYSPLLIYDWIYYEPNESKKIIFYKKQFFDIFINDNKLFNYEEKQFALFYENKIKTFLQKQKIKKKIKFNYYFVNNYLDKLFLINNYIITWHNIISFDNYRLSILYNFLKSKKEYINSTYFKYKLNNSDDINKLKKIIEKIDLNKIDFIYYLKNWISEDKIVGWKENLDKISYDTYRMLWEKWAWLDILSKINFWFLKKNISKLSWKNLVQTIEEIKEMYLNVLEKNINYLLKILKITKKYWKIVNEFEKIWFFNEFYNKYLFVETIFLLNNYVIEDEIINKNDLLENDTKYKLELTAILNILFDVNYKDITNFVLYNKNDILMSSYISWKMMLEKKIQTPKWIWTDK